MNRATIEIAEYVAKNFEPCDLQTARRIQDHMENEQGVDFSECSRAQFNKAVRTAWRELMP